MEGIRMMIFKPLPHEFGLRINIVPASISAAWVAGWEIGNTVRMVEQVLREGGIPIFSLVSVRFAFSGSQLVAVGGKSEVYFIKREGGQNSLQDVKFPQSLLPSSEPKSKKAQSPLSWDEVSWLPRILSKSKGKSNLGQGSSGEENLDMANSINLQQNLFSLLAFLSLRNDERSREIRDEVLRDYFLFLSGIISEEQFARRLRNFDMKAKAGLFVSVYA
ncbi:MAG: hypothetical protein ACO2PO_04605 [Candidatus Calescibacterium sp.]